mmetsp:Transcript_27658/g.62444  ORF Transcript_27658/g.62444 Transcript_27658/m.62444 type:complete len:206 (+) Transcript_27658:413-1030(+)
MIPRGPPVPTSRSLTNRLTKKPFVSSPSSPSHRTRHRACSSVSPATALPLRSQCSRQTGDARVHRSPSSTPSSSACAACSSSAVETTASFSSSCTEQVEYTILSTFGNDIACFSMVSWKFARDCTLLVPLSSPSSANRSGELTMPLPEQLGSSSIALTFSNSAGSDLRKSPWTGRTATSEADDLGTRSSIRCWSISNLAEDRSKA